MESTSMKATTESTTAATTTTRSYCKCDIPFVDVSSVVEEEESGDAPQNQQIQQQRRRRCRVRIHLTPPPPSSTKSSITQVDDKNQICCKNLTDEDQHSTMDDHNNVVMVDNNNIIDTKTIPESVLVYQQQLRKRQAAQKAGTPATPDQLKVIFVDDALVVADKPSGMLCVPGINNHPSLLSLVYDKFGKSTSGSDDHGDGSSNIGFDGNPNGMIVHRLDMDTSGLVVFGRTPAIVAQLHKQFRDRHIRKEYEALVCGHVQLFHHQHHHEKAQSGTIDNPNHNSNATNPDDSSLSLWTGWIDLPLQRDHERPPFMRVATPTSERAATRAVADLQQHGFQKLIRKRPKPSQTEFTVLSYEQLVVPLAATTAATATNVSWESIAKTNPVAMVASNLSTTTTTTTAAHSDMGMLPVTRLRLIPHTGRTHQLRVHCAAMGHAILGDPAYGWLGEANPNGGFHEDIMQMAFPFRATTTVQESLRQAYDNNNKNDNPTGGMSQQQQEQQPLQLPRPMCLHAKLLGFHHPVTGENMVWESPAPF